jgi:hypothetical protein
LARRLSALTTSDERFDSLADALLADPLVSEGRMFGSRGLKVGGKVFAILVKERLVVKLPGERVAALISAGEGLPFDPGHGRVLKEWVTIPPESDVDWLALAIEAEGFLR